MYWAKINHREISPVLLHPSPLIHSCQFFFGKMVNNPHANTVSKDIDNSVAAISERYKLE